jgi:hypothetical protein
MIVNIKLDLVALRLPNFELQLTPPTATKKPSRFYRDGFFILFVDYAKVLIQR